MQRLTRKYSGSISTNDRKIVRISTTLLAFASAARPRITAKLKQRMLDEIQAYTTSYDITEAALRQAVEQQTLYELFKEKGLDKEDDLMSYLTGFLYGDLWEFFGKLAPAKTYFGYLNADRRDIGLWPKEQGRTR